MLIPPGESVVDMFALRFFSVFTVADIAISLGALCMHVIVYCGVCYDSVVYD